MAEEQWNPTAVIAQAKELIHTSNYEKVDLARQQVDETLRQWVQTATTDGGNERAALVVELWQLYATLELELRQFKQATKVFESAVSCPIAGKSKSVWLQYASFCIDRKKHSNARKVFLRGLHAVADQDQDALWESFHAFVCKHVDPNVSLKALQTQLFPDKFAVQTAAAIAPVVVTTPTELAKESAPAPVSQQPSKTDETPVPAAASTPQEPVTATASSLSAPVAPAAVENPVAPPEPVEVVPVIDPAVAFVDKTGTVDLYQVAPTDLKRAMQSSTPAETEPKRMKRTEAAAGVVINGGQSSAVSSTETHVSEKEAAVYFLHVPMTLPHIPGCPHLLFDAVPEGESQAEIGNELLERLSEVLGDSAVFDGVKDLRDNQRQRDRDTLYRWQDLVGMQMKEGGELFARHALVEREGGSDARELIAMKNQHLEQRREFVHRCQMSQQQFIEICAMDRANALKAQQISLENLKIPDIVVTTDEKAISMQRAIVGLILEAEKLWREENSKPAEVVPPKERGMAAAGAPALRETAAPSNGVGSSSGPSGYTSSRPVRRDSRDYSTYTSRPVSSGGPRSSGRGARGPIPVGHRRSASPPPYASRGAKRYSDHYPQTSYDRAPPREQQKRPVYQGRQPWADQHMQQRRDPQPYAAPLHQQQPPPQFDRFGHAQHAAGAREYNNPDFGGYAPQEMMRAGRGGGWQQQQQQPPPMRGHEFSPMDRSSRMGPPSNGPPAYANRQASPSGGPGSYHLSGRGAPHRGMQQQQAPGYDDFAPAYDQQSSFAPPQGNTYRQPHPSQQQPFGSGPPPQFQQQQQPYQQQPFQQQQQQRGHVGGRGGFGGRGGGDRYPRRGGGAAGGGRYGRR